MKRALITLIALAVGMSAFAQYGPGLPGRGYGYGYGHSYGPGHGYRPGGFYMQDGALEFGITLNHFSKAGDTFRPDRLGFFAEYRVDVSPMVDMGLQLSTTFGKGSYSTDGEPFGPDVRFWQGAPLVVTDVNLLPYSGFNPYLGLGIGPGFGYQRSEFADRGEWTQALVLSPRAGIELFDCLRMGVQYQWYLNKAFTYSHFSFGISWAFGLGRGGRRPMRR